MSQGLQPDPRPAVGSKEWWLGTGGFRFVLQVFTLMFLLFGLIQIGRFFFAGGDEGRVDLSNVPEAQGLIAGVLLITIVVIEMVAIMTALFSDGTESLKDRVQLVRDILAPLLAIFGTVTGFYFGTKAVEGMRGGAAAPENPSGAAPKPDEQAPGTAALKSTSKKDAAPKSSSPNNENKGQTPQEPKAPPV